jgi:glutaredoxin
MESTMLRFLQSLFQRPRLEHLHFVLYTRQGCHLCEDAWRLLQKERQRYHFILEIVDIDTQGKLTEQFGDQVPVVTVNGQIRFRGGINPVLLARLLQAEIQRGNG